MVILVNLIVVNPDVTALTSCDVLDSNFIASPEDGDRSLSSINACDFSCQFDFSQISDGGLSGGDIDSPDCINSDTILSDSTLSPSPQVHSRVVQVPSTSGVGTTDHTPETDDSNYVIDELVAKSPMMTVFFGVKGIVCPMDTGAQATLLPHQIFSNVLGHKLEELKPLPPGFRVVGANQLDIPILGYCFISIVLGCRRVRAGFMITDVGSGTNVIIGCNILLRLGLSPTATLSMVFEHFDPAARREPLMPYPVFDYGTPPPTADNMPACPVPLDDPPSLDTSSTIRFGQHASFSGDSAGREILSDFDSDSAHLVNPQIFSNFDRPGADVHLAQSDDHLVTPGSAMESGVSNALSDHTRSSLVDRSSNIQREIFTLCWRVISLSSLRRR